MCHHELGARCRERDRTRSPDPTSGTCNDHFSTLEWFGHRVPYIESYHIVLLMEMAYRFSSQALIPIALISDTVHTAVGTQGTLCNRIRL
jgi:hypothetical protein